MSKKTNSSSADFSWAKNSGFTPPGQASGALSGKASAPPPSQVSDLKTLLDELLNTLFVTVKASAGIIRIVATHGQALQPISFSGLPPGLFEADNSDDLACKACEMAGMAQNVYSADISSCSAKPTCRYTHCQFQSIIVVPITNSLNSDAPAGKLTLFFKNSPPANDHTTQTILSFARMINFIVEQNKLFRDSKRVDQMAERQAIANEIHDSLAQTLVYTRMRTSSLLESIRTGNELMSAKYARDIDEALEISQKTVRELITDFRCAMDPSGLLHALQTLTGQFCQRNEISLEYINRVAHLELPLEHEIQVFHIVQEALSNISTHSGATHARLIVDYSAPYYIFTIKDNGSGGCTFTPVEGHYGMMIMRERAQRIGGEIKVESAKGHGTLVQLFFPEPGNDWRAINE